MFAASAETDYVAMDAGTVTHASNSEAVSSMPRRFDDRPLLVFWETTKACDLACFHCRACAQPDPSPDELTTAEGRRLIDELAAMGRPRPILVLTGGDCLKREDVLALVAYASEHAVPVAVAPSVTPHLKDRTLRALRERGVKTMSLSLDGAVASTHDAIRGIEGHFDETVAAIDSLKGHGFTVQINTTVMATNLEELADIAALLSRTRVDIWEVFFLIATGRGTDVIATTAQQNEDVCHFLVNASRYGFTVRTVEAPFFRRVAEQRRALTSFASSPTTGALYAALTARLVALLGEAQAPVRAPSAATRDGKGIIFIGANGDVYPSGFLPLRLGNVRERRLGDIYRDDPVLRSIRDAVFSGACGSCEYAQLCGGSRARAYAASGDPLGPDPGCLVAASSLNGLIPRLRAIRRRATPSYR